MSNASQTPILPPKQPEERPLFFIMTIMAFLAGLTLIGALIGIRLSDTWQDDLAKAATVQVYLEDGQERTNIAKQAKTLLEQSSAVKKAVIISEEEATKLVRPWLGDMALPDDIPLPLLIELDLKQSQGLDVSALKSSLSDNDITADIDDHRQWANALSQTWQRVRTAMSGLILLMLAATIAISSYATQSVLRARKNIIDVLGQVGATDYFIARLFVTRFLSLSLKAAITGSLLAIIFAAIFLTWQNVGSEGLSIGMKVTDLIPLALLTLLIGAIGAITAGYMTLQSIRRDHRLS